MVWWMWAIVGWATVASAAALWLAVQLSATRWRDFSASAADVLRPAGPVRDLEPVVRLDPTALLGAARAALERTRAAVGQVRLRDR